MEGVNPDSQSRNTRISQIVNAALQHGQADELLSLSGDDAQLALDELWQILEHSTLLDTPSESPSTSPRDTVRRLSLKLALKSNRLPVKLFLKDVQCLDMECRGSGGFSDVFIGKYRNTPVALKRLRFHTASPESARNALVQSFYRESLLWKNLNHPHIVPFLGVSDEIFRYHLVCMVLPWMERGSIRQYIDGLKLQGLLPTHGPHFTQPVDRWLHQISLGLSYLHQEGIVHGDLHGGNVLVDDEGKARLTDFGMALIAEATAYNYGSVHGGGAVRWLAPELVYPEQFGLTSTRPTCASDMYAFACTCVELYTGQKPFADIPDRQLVFTVLKGMRPSRPQLADGEMMSDSMWFLTTSCWASNPTQRPQAQHVSQMLQDIISSYQTVGSTKNHVCTFPTSVTSIVTCMILSHGRIIMSSDDGTTRVYVARTGELLHVLAGHQGGVWAMAATKGTLVTGSTDQTIHVWDLLSGRCTHIFRGHRGTVRSLAIVKPEEIGTREPDGGIQREVWPKRALIVSGSRDRSLRVWNLPQCAEAEYIDDEFSEEPDPGHNPYHKLHLTGHTDAVRSLAAQGRTAVSGSFDHTVRVWDIVTGKCSWVLSGHTQKVYSVVLDVQRYLACSASMDATVRVWNVENGQCQHVLTGHTSLVGLLRLSPGYLVSASADATLRMWDPISGELRRVLNAHSGAITCFQHNDQMVISGSEGAIYLWDVQRGTREPLRVGVPDVYGIAFDGRFCVAAVKLWLPLGSKRNTANDLVTCDVWEFERGEDDSSMWSSDEEYTDARMGEDADAEDNPEDEVF